ncbi:MAG: hypothetical protein M8467_18140, partial [Anaerolineae bacterium]|nr:hypothetical protein [Anaerolineae bacterium]
MSKEGPQPEKGTGGGTSGRARRQAPGTPRRLLAHLLAFLALIGLSLLLVAQVSAQAPCPVPLEERQRYGFAAFSTDWPQAFAIDQLKAGWYVDHARVNNPPGGMDRALVLRVHAGYRLDASTLGPLVDANPGAMWLIGNEPDCIWQDN